MKLPIDVASRVSRELSTLIERLATDPDREEPPTLADVRTVVSRRVGAAGRREESMHPQQSASMLDEVDDLIAEFGAEAAAVDFVAAKASEPLSRIIEVAIGDAPPRRKSTLATVRDAMAGGLIARLVGDGIIEADEDQTLLAEIDALIERHGPDAVAEEFVRFE